jgi:hypothetical protein
MDDSKPKNDDAVKKPSPSDDPSVPIDFSTFILSLSSSAAYHLGIAPHPEDASSGQNLPMAKQTIDILSILQDKTSGNLTGEEERLLSEVLYNLRMAFVRESQKKHPK